MKTKKILKALKALQKECEKQKTCDEKCRCFEICPATYIQECDLPEFWDYLKLHWDELKETVKDK